MCAAITISLFHWKKYSHFELWIIQSRTIPKDYKSRFSGIYKLLEGSLPYPSTILPDDNVIVAAEWIDSHVEIPILIHAMNKKLSNKIMATRWQKSK